MRTTIDKVGRLVSPKPLPDRLGLRPGEVESHRRRNPALRVEPVTAEAVEEHGGGLVIPRRAPPSTATRSWRCAVPTRGSEPDILLDTSVAMALVVSDHEVHQLAIEPLDGRRLEQAGHAAFQTFSVLTRLPPPIRRAPAVVARLLEGNFPENRFLSLPGASELHARLGEGEIAGGSVYDALVGASAVEHRLALAALDRRALDTYRVLGVSVELLGTGRHNDLR